MKKGPMGPKSKTKKAATAKFASKEEHFKVKPSFDIIFETFPGDISFNMNLLLFFKDVATTLKGIANSERLTDIRFICENDGKFTIRYAHQTYLVHLSQFLQKLFLANRVQQVCELNVISKTYVFGSKYRRCHLDNIRTTCRMSSLWWRSPIRSTFGNWSYAFVTISKPFVD